MLQLPGLGWLLGSLDCSAVKLTTFFKLRSRLARYMYVCAWGVFGIVLQPDFDLCAACEASDDPKLNDLYMRIDTPSDAVRSIQNASQHGIFWGRTGLDNQEPSSPHQHHHRHHQRHRHAPFPGAGSGGCHVGEGGGGGGRGRGGGFWQPGSGGRAPPFWGPYAAGPARWARRGGARCRAWKNMSGPPHQEPAGAESDETTGEGSSVQAGLVGVRAEACDLPLVDHAKLDARFVADVTVFDGTEIVAGTSFVKVWRMRNTGQGPWPATTTLLHVGGDLLTDGSGCTPLLVQPCAAPGLELEQECDLAVHMQAPRTTGRYVAYFRLATEGGPKFGQRIWAFIQVVPNANSPVLVEQPGVPPAVAFPLQVDTSTPSPLKEEKALPEEEDGQSKKVLEAELEAQPEAEPVQDGDTENLGARALAQLEELGFEDVTWNRVLLAKNSHNVQACVNELLNINAEDVPHHVESAIFQVSVAMEVIDDPVHTPESISELGVSSGLDVNAEDVVTSVKEEAIVVIENLAKEEAVAKDAVKFESLVEANGEIHGVQFVDGKTDKDLKNDENALQLEWIEEYDRNDDDDWETI